MSWPWSRRIAFPYPTSSTFVAQVCLGVAASLTVLGVLLHVSPLAFPAFWLAAPALLAYLAAWAMGPGMREEFFVNPESRSIFRRVRTLGVPNDEEVLTRDSIRLVGIATPRDPGGTVHGAYVVLVDTRGRWLTFAHYGSIERARTDSNRVAKALVAPAVEYRCGTDWIPYWGRIQPPPPPETASLGLPGAEAAGAGAE